MKVTKRESIVLRGKDDRHALAVHPDGCGGIVITFLPFGSIEIALDAAETRRLRGVLRNCFPRRKSGGDREDGVDFGESGRQCFRIYEDFEDQQRGLTLWYAERGDPSAESASVFLKPDAAAKFGRAIDGWTPRR